MGRGLDWFEPTTRTAATGPEERAAARLALGGLQVSWNIARNIESAEPLEDLSTRFGLPYFCSTELDPVLYIYACDGAPFIITGISQLVSYPLGLIGSPKLLKASSSAPKGEAWPHRNDS